jgi:pentatricopeptide repeat domain-containing protein 1
MLTMIRKTSSFFSYSDCSNSRIGMPCCLHSTTPVVSLNNYFALFHSQSSKPSKSQLGKLVRDAPSKPIFTNLESALKVFDEMLHRRPLPSVVRFTQILGQLAKLKHYSAVITLNKQMGLIGISRDAYTLTIIINCYCRLNQMGFSLSVLGHFFKLGLKPDTRTFNTLINGFVLENRVAEATRLFSKMVEEGHCRPT